jgi:hypothetical protein
MLFHVTLKPWQVKEINNAGSFQLDAYHLLSFSFHYTTLEALVVPLTSQKMGNLSLF